jgi:hypothetical protein
VAGLGRRARAQASSVLRRAVSGHLARLDPPSLRLPPRPLPAPRLRPAGTARQSMSGSLVPFEGCRPRGLDGSLPPLEVPFGPDGAASLGQRLTAARRGLGRAANTSLHVPPPQPGRRGRGIRVRGQLPVSRQAGAAASRGHGIEPRHLRALRSQPHLPTGRGLKRPEGLFSLGVFGRWPNTPVASKAGRPLQFGSIRPLAEYSGGLEGRKASSVGFEPGRSATGRLSRIGGEPACKPSSVPRLTPRRRSSISGRRLPDGSSGRPEDWAARPLPFERPVTRTSEPRPPIWPCSG